MYVHIIKTDLRQAQKIFYSSVHECGNRLLLGTLHIHHPEQVKNPSKGTYSKLISEYKWTLNTEYRSCRTIKQCNYNLLHRLDWQSLTPARETWPEALTWVCFNWRKHQSPATSQSYYIMIMCSLKRFEHKIMRRRIFFFPVLHRAPTDP